MFPIFLLLLYEVSGGDQVHHDQVQQHHHQLQEPCSPLRLSKCSELLTRALDKHDFGFVTTELGLNSLCELVLSLIIPHLLYLTVKSLSKMDNVILECSL